MGVIEEVGEIVTGATLSIRTCIKGTYLGVFHKRQSDRQILELKAKYCSACIILQVGAVEFSRNPYKYFVFVVQMQWLPPNGGHTPPFHNAAQALTLLQSGKITSAPNPYGNPAPNPYA